MVRMSDFLTRYKRPNIKEVLNSRVVFYPACYNDGFMVEVFNPSHSAYVYLYADYAMTEEKWIEILSRREFNRQKTDGHMEAIAEETKVYPKFMIFGHAAEPWSCSFKVPEVYSQCGGGWGYGRTLYMKEKSGQGKGNI